MKATLFPVVRLFSLAAGLMPLWPGAAAAQSLSDLSYTAVPPCRVADTRAAGGSLAPGTPRDLRVTGTALQAQGGNPAGCGIPVGVARAVLINLVAVNPVGPGNLRAWAYSTPPVAPPFASVLNYALVPGSGLNLANAIALPLCNVDAGACPFDLRVQAAASGTHLIADVVGYFARPVDLSSLRYIVEAGPGQVGHVLPLDVARLDQLCRDKDGCEVTIGMVNWNAAGQPGQVASRSARLFLSESSRWWRLSNDIDGLDGNGGLNEWAVFDCWLTDAETWTGTPNGRGDAGVGFALLNVAGGDFSDLTTICRIIIED
jgi:hypothetical protein